MADKRKVHDSDNPNTAKDITVIKPTNLPSAFILSPFKINLNGIIKTTNNKAAKPTIPKSTNA